MRRIRSAASSIVLCQKGNDTMSRIARMFKRCKRAPMIYGFRVEYENVKGGHGELILHFSYDDLCDDKARILLGVIVYRKRSRGVIYRCVKSMVEVLLDMPSFSSPENDGAQGATFIFFDPVKGMTPNDDGYIMLKNGIEVIQCRVVVVFPLKK